MCVMSCHYFAHLDYEFMIIMVHLPSTWDYRYLALYLAGKKETLTLENICKGLGRVRVETKEGMLPRDESVHYAFRAHCAPRAGVPLQWKRSHKASTKSAKETPPPPVPGQNELFSPTSNSYSQTRN